MHYFWFIPMILVLIGGICILYIVVARGLPKKSTRSVEDALAEERSEDEAAQASASAGPHR